MGDILITLRSSICDGISAASIFLIGNEVQLATPTQAGVAAKRDRGGEAERDKQDDPLGVADLHC